MSDEGEKSCPLCAEEMDLTDQQLKPCKCGYEICVWCWHHIMDMAQKDDTEGRCPACRSAYDKEKIVGMTSNCERLVAEMSMEKKIKSQKANAKSSEGRRQLGSVRVIQRNLVYIVGLPLNLADEDLLQRREYFGQYGKVLKVSMSRAATGAIQQFPNNTCSVYITYLKEDEAIRCIQNVHQFVLEGKSLRACFGTTKYCHAWLRNVLCTNPECLYLHEVGSQEDSFTKDEIISAYTRSRVQQITGASNNLQRRSGNMLPPPIDDYSNYGSTPVAKPIMKNASNSSGSILRDSPPNGSASKSVALPATASWGTRGSNCLPQAINSACSNVNAPAKLKSDSVSVTSAFSGASESSSLQYEAGKKPIINGSEITVTKNKIESSRPVTSLTSRLDTPEKESTSVAWSSQLSNLPESKDHKNRKSLNSNLESEVNKTSDVNINKLCSDISSMGTDKDVEGENASGISRKTSASDKDLIKAPRNHQGLKEFFPEHFRESSFSAFSGRDVSTINGTIYRDEYDWTSKLVKDVQKLPEAEEDLMSFSSQRHNDPQVVSHSNYLPSLTSSLNGYHCPGTNEANRSIGVKDYSVSLDKKHRDDLLGSSVFSDNSVHSFAVPSEGRRQIGRFESNASSANGNAHLDKVESSIISNILSMDYDVWNDSLTSPQNLAKLLGETDKQSSSLIMSSPWRGQNNNQSRFSFARQEESRIQDAIHSPLNGIGQLQKNHSLRFSIPDDNASADKFRVNNGLYSVNYDGSENHSGNQIPATFNKFSAFPRAQISAPPGFSAANRAAPPGFSSSLERLDQSSEPIAGNHLQGTSSLPRNIYPAPQAGISVNTGDLDFMDPAILAVGKGRIQLGLGSPGLDTRSNFTSQSSSFESDPGLQFFMQRPLSSHQNFGVSDVRDGFNNHVSDSYGSSSRLVDQSHVKNLSPFAQMSFQHPRNGVLSNGHWDNGVDVQGGNNMGNAADTLRSDRLGFNTFYSSFEDSKFRMPSSGDLYNRTFRM